MAMCASCGRELEPAWKFCIHCGAAVPETAFESVPETGSATAPETRETPVIAAANTTDAAVQADVASIPLRLDTDVAASNIPAAIRPEPTEQARPTEQHGRAKTRSRLDVPLLIGIVLGVAGVVLLAYIAIALFGPHA